MGKAAAYCPSFVTGIFTIGKGDAAGAGFSIDRGMTTSVSESGKASIAINGKADRAPVSRAVLRKYGKTRGVSVSHRAELPVGFGMGMSAAGAVSLSLALNELFGCGLSREECVKIAHDAEVECGTGLSGADAAAMGGFLGRRSLKHRPEKLPFARREIHLAFFSAINTRSIISDARWKGRVNSSGRQALALLFSKGSWGGFVEASRLFASGCGLGAWCKEHMATNPRASMAMVGRTLFSDEKMALAGPGARVIQAMASERGAELV